MSVGPWSTFYIFTLQDGSITIHATLSDKSDFFTKISGEVDALSLRVYNECINKKAIKTSLLPRTDFISWVMRRVLAEMQYNERKKVYILAVVPVWANGAFAGNDFAEDIQLEFANGGRMTPEQKNEYKTSLISYLTPNRAASQLHPSPQSGGRRKKPRPLPSKVLTGPKGGKYVIKAGQKVYV